MTEDHVSRFLFEENREIVDYLKETPLFSNLDDQELQEMIPFSEIIERDPGHVIIQEGQKNDRLYFLMRGMVGVYSDGESILKLQRKGDIIGEMSVITSSLASASVIAETRVTLFAISTESILSFNEGKDVEHQHSIEKVLYRFFSVILTEKLSITTHKARQFESTNRELEEARIALENSHEHLEKKVEERTAELLDLNVKLKEEITERKKAAQAIRQAKEEAERANQAKSGFIARMSHEMRTPLNGIIGFSELILGRQLPKEITKYTHQILSESKILLELINSLLDHAKIASGKLDLEMIPFHLGKALDEMHSLMRIRAVQKGLEYHAVLDPDIPEYLMGDPKRIRQILMNFISNATKFTETGNIRISGDLLGLSDKQVKLKFTVKDTGIGIPEDHQAKIFDSFTQADGSITRKFGGTGLGTTIAKEMVELMNGEVGLSSKPGEGSEFWFTIVLSPVTGEVEEKEIAREQLGNDSILRRKYNGRILVAEDYPTNQAVVRKHLEAAGCRVDIAENGQIACDLFQQNDYDLVLMDMQMPIMDGLTATGKIRQWEKEHSKQAVPILALTANAYSRDREQCLEAGMDDFLEKPLRQKALMMNLAKWLKTELNSESMVVEKKQTGNPNSIQYPYLIELFNHNDIFTNKMVNLVLDQAHGFLTEWQRGLLKQEYTQVEESISGFMRLIDSLKLAPLSGVLWTLNKAVKSRDSREIGKGLKNYQEVLKKIKIS